MRPRKVVLLCCADDVRRSVLSFVLWVRGYDVIAGISAHPPVPELALIVDDYQAEDMAKLVEQALPELPIMIVGSAYRRVVPYNRYPVKAAVLCEDTSAEHLLLRVRLMTFRKRGPKKRAPIFSPAVPVEGAPCLS